MSCLNCNSTASVAIGRKQYCTNCGETLSVAAHPTTKTARPNPTVVPSAPRTPVAKPITSVVAPVAPQRLMRDIGGPAKPQAVRVADPNAKPAEAFHARLKPARGGVLDLRASTKPVRPKAVTATSIHASRATVTPAPPRPVPAMKPAPEPKKHTSIAASAMHAEAKVQLPVAPTAQPARQKQAIKHHETAAVVARSEHISRFAPKKPVAATHVTAAHPAHAEPVRELPAQTAAQHEHMSRLISVMKADAPNAHPQATNPSRASFAMAAIAVAAIGSYIWMHNYPQLALSTAADKAGFSASLPSFVPSSYSLKGSPSYSPGVVTLNFTSPSFANPLKATQQPTAWDTRSLLDNYVAAKTAQYTPLTGQGLTIFVLDNGKEATWINHGIWYSLDGVANLSRDQLLKMAYSF